MRILQIVPSYKPAYLYGGPIISIAHLCERINKRDIEVTVFSTTANGKKELPVFSKEPKLVNGVPVYYFKRITKDHSHFSPQLLWKLFRNTKNYDLIHIHSWWNLTAIFSVSICLLKGAKPILSVRGMMSDYTFGTSNFTIKNFFHLFIGKYLLRRCLIHVTSKKEKEECLKRIGKVDCFKLPNFITLPIEQELSKKPNDKVFRFVMLSRIHPIKNIEFFFNCINKLDFEYEVCIIGDGEYDYINKLKSLAEYLNISKKIKWEGGLYNDQIKLKKLSENDLFVQLSHTENFGNSVIESAAAGIPVMVSEGVGAAEYVQELKIGFVTPLIEEVVVKKIENYRKQVFENVMPLGNVRQKTMDFFSYTNLVKAYTKVYQQALISHG